MTGSDGVLVETVTDAQRVRQILLNLLSNAIKFTDEGEVVVSVRETVNEVEIAVRDTGIGIPAHQLKELFQDFHQLEAGDGRRYGTARRPRASRGVPRAGPRRQEIEVRSREGQGATFTLLLPKLHPPVIPSAESSSALLASGESERPPKVLS